jgi:hypothetical protein
MKAFSIITLLLLLISATAFNPVVPGDKKAKILQGTGEVSFFSKAAFKDVDAASTKLTSKLNTEINEITFHVPTNSFVFKVQKMQKDFYSNYMNPSQYPDINYKGKIQEKIDWSKEGTYHATSKGTLTIHKVPKERTDSATIVIANGMVEINGKFEVNIADHQIKNPRMMGKKLVERVIVTFKEKYPRNNTVL